MKHVLQYQYKPHGAARPEDYCQIDDLILEQGDPIVLPAVGDSVTLHLTSERLGAYQVVSRHFSYVKGAETMYCCINIVVTDISDDEMAARLKE